MYNPGEQLATTGMASIVILGVTFEALPLMLLLGLSLLLVGFRMLRLIYKEQKKRD